MMTYGFFLGPSCKAPARLCPESAEGCSLSDIGKCEDISDQRCLYLYVGGTHNPDRATVGNQSNHVLRATQRGCEASNATKR